MRGTYQLMTALFVVFRSHISTDAEQPKQTHIVDHDVVAGSVDIDKMPHLRSFERIGVRDGLEASAANEERTNALNNGVVRGAEAAFTNVGLVSKGFEAKLTDRIKEAQIELQIKPPGDTVSFNNAFRDRLGHARIKEPPKFWDEEMYTIPYNGRRRSIDEEGVSNNAHKRAPTTNFTSWGESLSLGISKKPRYMPEGLTNANAVVPRSESRYEPQNDGAFLSRGIQARPQSSGTIAADTIAAAPLIQHSKNALSQNLEVSPEFNHREMPRFFIPGDTTSSIQRSEQNVIVFSSRKTRKQSQKKKRYNQTAVERKGGHFSKASLTKKQEERLDRIRNNFCSQFPAYTPTRDEVHMMWNFYHWTVSTPSRAMRTFERKARSKFGRKKDAPVTPEETQYVQDLVKTYEKFVKFCDGNIECLMKPGSLI